MTPTLLLAERPFRTLLSRALIAHAAAAVPHAPPMVIAMPGGTPPTGFAIAPPGEVPPGTGQVVIAGAFLERAALDAALDTASRAVAAGARLVVEAFSLEGEAARIAPPDGLGVLERAAAITVRDHRTLNVLTLWRLAAPARIAPYPERDVRPDPRYAAALPPGPILGLAIRGGAEMRKSWAPRVPAIRRLLARVEGWPVLPLLGQAPGAGDCDLAGSRDFAAAVLPGSPLLGQEIEDPVLWRRHARPARLKGQVARCALVVTNRDLPAAYAVACGVPVIGISLGADRRIVSCLATLANELPAGSDLVHPLPGP